MRAGDPRAAQGGVRPEAWDRGLGRSSPPSLRGALPTTIVLSGIWLAAFEEVLHPHAGQFGLERAVVHAGALTNEVLPGILLVPGLEHRHGHIEPAHPPCRNS